MIVVNKTTAVDAMISFLVGQVTFFISTLTSLRNWTILFHIAIYPAYSEKMRY